MYSEQQQIYWHSGLYLQPQHFQSLDLHYEWQLAQHLRLAQPFNFGLLDVAINEAALSDFVISVEQIHLIMPGGTLLSFPGNCQVEKRNIRDFWKQREKPLTVWLGLRRFDPQHSNVTTLGADKDRAVTRWVNTGEEQVMKDVYDRAPEATVARLCYNVRLLVDDETTDAVDCECIPLTRLCYVNDRVIADPAFSAPAVTIMGATNLEKTISAIYFELSSRAKKLEEYKRSERLVSDAERGEQVTQLLVMRSLNRVLPVLNSYCLARQVHPWHVYNLLCQLIGELSSFSDACSFLGEWRDGNNSLLPYDHYQLQDCFECIRTILITLLNGLVLEDNTYVMLENTLNDVFTGRFDNIQSQHADRVLLLLRSPNMPQENRLLAHLGGIKLAAPEAIEAIIQHALPGIPVTWCEQTPKGVPNRSDSYYFLIDKSSELWIKAVKHNGIAFYWPNMPDDLQVQIIFVVPS